MSQQAPFTPPTTRLDSSVLGTQPSSGEWAESTKSAILENDSAAIDRKVHNTIVPGITGPVIGPNSSGLDTTAKSQSEVEKTLYGNTASAVSTPGHELPGAWSDKPATGAGQVYNDVSNVLSSVGQAAYNAIPDSVKGAFSTQPTTEQTSLIQTTTNTHAAPQTNLTETASNAATTVTNAAAAAASAIAAGGAVAYEKAADTYNNTNVSTTLGATNIPGLSDSKTLADEQGETKPSHLNETLPSEDKQGALPLQGLGAQGGVGALPGNIDEKGVAVLPEEKATGNYTTPADSAYPSTTTALGGPSSTSAPPTSSYTETATNTASNAATTVSNAASAAAATVAATGAAAYERAANAVPTSGTTGGITDNNTSLIDSVPGLRKPLGGNENTAPFHQPQTLPSQEEQGALPSTRLGPTGGVGALPGRLSETGVALLPEEKANPDPLATASSEYATAKQNTIVASPYHSDSPYADTNANAVKPPAGAPGASTGAPGGVTHKAAETAEKVKDKALPSHSTSTPHDTTSDTPAHHESSSPAPSSTARDDTSSLESPGGTPKKVGLMAKIKGEVKILSGKMGHNEDKVEAGKALKTGN